MEKGLIVVISGPSGVGKGTVNARIINTTKNIDTAISATTRTPRDGETEGVHYYFCCKEDFEAKVLNGEFIEYASVHGNMYGTLISEVEKRTNEGKDVILEIDVQGGASVREKLADCVSIFILPPSLDELTSRLVNRATDSKEAIEARLQTAISEIKCVEHYDYVVINEDLVECAAMIKNIIKSEKQKVSRRHELVEKLLNGGNI